MHPDGFSARRVIILDIESFLRYLVTAKAHRPHDTVGRVQGLHLTIIDSMCILTCHCGHDRSSSIFGDASDGVSFTRDHRHKVGSSFLLIRCSIRYNDQT